MNHHKKCSNLISEKCSKLLDGYSMLKSGLFAVSVIIGVFILAAPFFNAEEKYEQANMDVETEISAFDETKTPASVPPQYARNKMQKSFGQV
ncbi:hypothetical protein P9265_19605, partial [Schinkia azotoformans]|nr:hypothetical protein [Schinkia azotoformans]